MTREFKTDYLPNGQKYTPELVEKAAGYLGQFNYEGDVVPTHERLCLYLKVSRASIYSWAKQFPEFAAILEEINLTQTAKIINGSLKNELNANISKLMLGSQGYHEKQETDHTSSDGSMSPTKKLTHEEIEAEMIKRGLPLSLLEK